MSGFLGPMLCVPFYVLVRDYLSMWTENGLFQSGWISSASCCRAERLVGIGRQVTARLRHG